MAGVVEVHNLQTVGEVIGDQVPNPGRAVGGNTRSVDWSARLASTEALDAAGYGPAATVMRPTIA